MHCELDRAVFAEVLGVVTQVIPARTTFPIYQNVLLEVAGGELTIIGSDGDTTIKKNVRLERESANGTALVRGRELTSLGHESSSETVVLDVDDNMLRVTSGRFKASLVQYPVEDFPPFPSLPEEGKVEFSVATLFEMFDACSFAVSKDDTRPAITGINWEISKNESRMVATDSFRLVCITRKIKSIVKAKLLLPPKVLGVLPRGGDKVKVYFDPKMVGFQLEDMTMVTRMIEGPYPDYEKVIPKENSGRVVVKRDELIAVVRRAAVIAASIGRPISLEFRRGGVAVRAENPDLGRSEEILDCNYDGETVRIGFNGNFLLEILRHIGGEGIRIEFSSPMAPVFLKPAEPKTEGEDLFILMPIRLD